MYHPGLFFTSVFQRRKIKCPSFLGVRFTFLSLFLLGSMCVTQYPELLLALSRTFELEILPAWSYGWRFKFV